ncbi:MAG: LemA family protein, partial [Ensifer adhaerens]
MIGLAIAVVVILYLVFVYNGLVKARQIAEEAWSGIDVQLKRRADLIPNLIETVKGYAAHEKSTFEEVIAMRNRAQAVPAGDVEGRAQAEGALSQALGKLFALAEAYPDLKANENFAELQRSLETIEGEIQMSRRYY